MFSCWARGICAASWPATSRTITGSALTSRSTRMPPADGQSSRRRSAGQSRFPKSMARIIAMSAGRRSPAQPGQSSSPSTRLLTPLLASDRAPSSTQAPVLACKAERLRAPTALLPTSLGVFACQKNTDARQASSTRFWRRTGCQASAHPTTHTRHELQLERASSARRCAPWRRWLRGSPSAHASAIEADDGERRGSRKAMSAGVD